MLIKTISVVITTYNYGAFIKEAVDSVLNQTLAIIEIIIIDDGSRDNTKDIVAEFNDPRIMYCYQKNQGQPKAKNRGICESSGELVAFLDADDVWLPSKLAKQVALFSNPEVGVVYSRRKWIDPSGKIISGNERALRKGSILNYIFVDNFICFSSSVLRRSYLEEVGYFDESLPMGIDYDLWIRLASVCKFDFVEEPLVLYRTGHANLSKNTLKRYECAQAIMRKNLSDPKVRDAMSWWVPNLAWADTWSNFGVYLASLGDYKASFFYSFKSILKFPIYLAVYKRLLKSLLYFIK
jgi:glycosyltransferase involved in cell wall biosynthesis